MTRVLVLHELPIGRTLREEYDIESTEASNGDEAMRLLSDADVFIVNPSNWDDELVSAMDEVSWVQATSAGVDCFPVTELKRRDIILTNSAGIHDPAVADHAMTLLLAVTRKLKETIQYQNQSNWRREIGDSVGDLHGGTMLVYGLGSIGESIARRAQAFGMTVYGAKRAPDTYDGCLNHDHVYTPDGVVQILPDVDAVVLSVPLTDDTRGVVNDDFLSEIPDSAFLINVSRGRVVDQQDLLDCLIEGGLAGAGLDVFEREPLPPESELWDLENVIVTPHIAGRSSKFVSRFADLFHENYNRYQSGDTLVNCICQ